MKNYQTLIGLIILSVSIVVAAVILKGALLEMAGVIYQGLI